MEWYDWIARRQYLPRSFESVAREIAEGLENGTIVHESWPGIEDAGSSESGAGSVEPVEPAPLPAPEAALADAPVNPARGS